MTPLPNPLFPEAFHNWLVGTATGDLVFDEVHAEAVDFWKCGQFYEAHECWEELWRGQGPETSLRRALQGLIRLAAAGVKGKAEHFAGFHHHLRGGLGHLNQAKTLGIERDWQGPNWAEILLWLQSASKVEDNLQG